MRLINALCQFAEMAGEQLEAPEELPEKALNAELRAPKVGSALGAHSDDPSDSLCVRCDYEAIVSSAGLVALRRYSVGLRGTEGILPRSRGAEAPYEVVDALGEGVGVWHCTVGRHPVDDLGEER
jgi:hypothetical protein